MASSLANTNAHVCVADAAVCSSLGFGGTSHPSVHKLTLATPTSLLLTVNEICCSYTAVILHSIM